MTDEAAFLAAIRAAPNDLAPRLVYADWLDDRSDPRGELIRVEEEMRSLPAFADRFWELKPRRHELRQLADPDWRAAFGYGTVARPLFGHGIPDDWKGRWRLIREFVERWHGIPLGDVGGRVEEVRAVEGRLGRALPAAVREWVAFAPDVLQDPRGDRVFRDVYSVAPVDHGSATSLLLQEDGDGICWGVRNRELGCPDPPVYEYIPAFTDDGVGPATEANGESDSVTEFVLEHVVWGNLRGAGGGFGVEVEDPAPLVRQLEATFPVRSRYRGIDIYEADDFFVSLYAHPGRAPGLEVEVARPLPRDTVPAFLWEYAKGGGRFHGMFVPRDLRLSGPRLG